MGGIPGKMTGRAGGSRAQPGGPGSTAEGRRHSPGDPGLATRPSRTGVQDGGPVAGAAACPMTRGRGGAYTCMNAAYMLGSGRARPGRPPELIP